MASRVAMILSNDAVSDPRVEKEAVALSSQGHTVTIVAWDRAGESPATEDRGVFDVIRVGPRAAHGAGLKNLPLYRAFWRDAARAVVGLGAQVVHCHDADTLPAGLSAMRELPSSARLVCDFHEMYRASKMIPQKGIKGTVARAAVDFYERRAVSRANIVVLANPSARDHYVRIGARDKIVLVENAPDAELFRPVTEPRAERPLTVCYLGQKRYPEPLEILMDAIGRVPGTAALLAGGGTSAQRIAQNAHGRENIEILGRIRYAEIPELYRRCDVVYAAVDSRVGNPRNNMPVKAMEGMACGLPVIVSGGTWVGTFVEENGVGFAVDESDVESVTAAISCLRDDADLVREMGVRGRALVDGGMNWQAASERLVAAYRSIGA